MKINDFLLPSSHGSVVIQNRSNHSLWSRPELIQRGMGVWYTLTPLVRTSSSGHRSSWYSSYFYWNAFLFPIVSVSFRVLVPVQSEYTISPVFHLLLYVKGVDRDPRVNLRDRQRVDFREYEYTTEPPCMNILRSIFFRVSFGTYFIFGVK